MLVIMDLIIGMFIQTLGPKRLITLSIVLMPVVCILFGALEFVEDTNNFLAMALVLQLFGGIGKAAYNIYRRVTCV